MPGLKSQTEIWVLSFARAWPTLGQGFRNWPKASSAVENRRQKALSGCNWSEQRPGHFCQSFFSIENCGGLERKVGGWPGAAPRKDRQRRAGGAFSNAGNSPRSMANDSLPQHTSTVSAAVKFPCSSERHCHNSASSCAATSLPRLRRRNSKVLPSLRASLQQPDLSSPVSIGSFGLQRLPLHLDPDCRKPTIAHAHAKCGAGSPSAPHAGPSAAS